LFVVLRAKNAIDFISEKAV